MADLSQSTKEQMNDPSNGLVPSKVSRKTVADGSWLQKYTFGKLSARDNFLADQIDGVSGNLASAYDDMVEDISALQGDVVSLSDEIKNMSPLTYRGNGSVTDIKNKTDKRNGDVYSIIGLSGSSAKSGVWWYGGTTKSGDDFKVKNNDEVAYTSAENKWFPIGQDIHVEYSAGENIEITDDNVINISGRVNLNLVAPITGALEGSTYNIGFSPISMTAQHINAIENNTDTTNRPLTWYNNETLNYNTGVYVNSDTFYAQNISSNSITGLATSASKVNVYNWSSDNNRPIAFVGTTTATSTGQYYSDVGIDSNTLYFNPSKDTLYSKNVSAANISADYINPQKIYIDNHTGGGEYWLLWSKVDGTNNQHLWYTNSAFRVNAQSGRISTPQINSTNLTALTAIGNSANFTNISAKNTTGGDIIGTNIRANSIVSNNIFPLPKYIVNNTSWNMGNDSNMKTSFDPYCRYFNIFNPTGGSSGHSANCGKYLTFNIATTYDSECTLLSYDKGNNAYFNLRLCLSSKSDKNDWSLGMLSNDKGYYENRLTASTANTFNISVGGGYLTTKIIVSPSKKFIVVKGGDCKFQGVNHIQ